MSEASSADGRALVDESTMWAPMDAALRNHGDRIAYVEGETLTTVGEHFDDAGKLAAALTRRSIGPGDRVAVLAANSRLYLALWHAALMGHFTLVPLNTRLSPPELRQVLANADAQILIHDSLFAALADRAVGDLVRPLPTLELTSLFSSAPAAGIDWPTVSAEDVTIIMYTSGTIGLPKGVPISQRALYAFFASAEQVWDMRSPGTVLYLATPLFHVSAAWGVLGAIMHGNAAVIVPSFDVGRLIADSRRHKITHASLIPTMLAQFLDHPDFRSADHQHLRFFQYGGAPINPVLIERLREALPNLSLVQCYGMTEAFAPLTCLTWEDHACGGERLKSCGRPLSNIKLRIGSSDDREVSDSGIGEIEAQSPALFTVYHNNPDASAAALHCGWYRTGDLGRFDQEGYLYVIDRLKDMIITGGENVYSQEVEHAIATCEGVARVAVIGRPSRKWGEEVHAIIVPRDGAVLTFEDISQSVRGRLAGFKCPKTITFSSDDLPLSASGKVDKKLLKERYSSAALQT